MTLTRAQMTRLAVRGAGMLGGAIRTGILGGAALAGAGIGAAIYKVVSAGLDFERYRTQLTGLMGSLDAGNRAMRWVTDFSARTPYEIGEVMEAFIALRAYGIDPADGSLRTLGDTASGMGKSLMDAVQMIADAQTGEFERLKEFGIRASQQGERVTFRFMRSGREMTRTVRKNAVEIQAALMTIFNERFAGGMERLAQTTAGKWSTLMDSLTTTANRVWEGGLGASINEQLDRLSGWIAEMENSGALRTWAQETGTAIGDLVRQLGSADWKGIASDIRQVAGAVGGLAGAFVSADRAARDFTAWNERNGAALSRLMERLGGVESDRRWGGLRYVPPSEIRRRRQGPPRDGAVEGPVDDSWGVPRPAPSPSPSPRTRLPPRSSSLVPSRLPGTRVEGVVAVRITTDRGTTATPTRVQASGLNIEVQTGRAMGGFA